MDKPAGRSNYTTGCIWRKRTSSRDSWEELAFAEDDAAGSLWPPRSYTCSFCRREFRSAQALGGHMNVHRRDRARLKQADVADDDNIRQYVFSSSALEPSRDYLREASCCTLVFSPSPNKSERSCVIDLASSSASLMNSRTSGLPGKEQDTAPQNTSLFPPSFYSYSSSPFVLEHSKNFKKILPNSLRSCPVSFGDHKRYKPSDEFSVLEGDKKRKFERDVSEFDLLNNTDLSKSLNLMIHRSLSVAHRSGYEEEEMDKSCKRRRRHESSSQRLISKSCKNDIVTRNNEEIKQKTHSFEDLDLELRLGAVPPKVN